MFPHSVVAKIDKPIDYAGQETVRKCLIHIFAVGYTASLCLGFLLGNLQYTLALGVATFLVVFLVTIPPWPFYRRNPPAFQNPENKKTD